MTNNIIRKIIEEKDSMSKKQKQFCDFILDNYQNIEIYSISTMAEKSGVGTTTILRTINSLGYSSLNEFKVDIHKVRIESHAPTWWQFEDDQRDDNESQSRYIWKNINLLQQYSMDKNLEQSISDTVEIFKNSSRINIFGLRTSRSVAIYLENSINQFYPKCNQLSYEPHFVFDRLYHMKQDEVLVLIALSQFTQLTYQVAEYAVEKGIPIILITDNPDNTIIPLATVTMKLAHFDKHYSIVPAISLVETLTVVLGSHLDDDRQEILKEVGALIADKDITQL
ncbi:MurR/RpiR family transcriptional regulator [Jeotgalicoccus huakuii]|nr:MurR/RpiR family transcriptional regulator [Jeotgalicoccus huakuii]